MKKYLLIGAMAIALGFGTGGARADDMPSAPHITVDGSWTNFVADESIGAPARGNGAAPPGATSAFAFEDGGLSFSATEKLDNGMTVKGVLGLDMGGRNNGPSGDVAASAPWAPGDFVTLNGGFGTIEIGRDAPVTEANAAGNCIDPVGFAACDSPYIGVWAPGVLGAAMVSANQYGYATIPHGAPTNTYSSSVSGNITLASMGASMGGGGSNATAWTTFHDDANVPMVAYTTPSFSGLQAAIDWQPPDANMAGNSQMVGCCFGSGGPAFANGSSAGTVGQTYHGTVFYNGTMNDVSISANIAYSERQETLSTGTAYISAANNTIAAVTANPYTGTAAHPTFNVSAWEGGVQVGYKGFSIGGHVIERQSPAGVNNAEKIQAQTGTSWSAGVAYASGPWAVGFNYLDSLAPDTVPNLANSGTTNDEETDWGLGATYSIGPGVKLIGEVYQRKTEINAPAGVICSAPATTCSATATDTGGLIGTEVNF